MSKKGQPTWPTWPTILHSILKYVGGTDTRINFNKSFDDHQPISRASFIQHICLYIWGSPWLNGLKGDMYKLSVMLVWVVCSLQGWCCTCLGVMDGMLSMYKLGIVLV